LRLLTLESVSFKATWTQDETCPIEKGIATKRCLQFQLEALHIHDETCPIEKGIATRIFSKYTFDFLFFLMKPALQKKGLRPE